MIPNYAYLDPEGWVRQWSTEDRPKDLGNGAIGPYIATPVEGLTLDLIPEGFIVSRNTRKVNGVYTDMTPSPQPSDTSVLQRVGEVLEWVETVSFAELQANAIEKTYADVDAIYDRAIGRRATEYLKAETEARSFAAAGFTGEVGGYVECFALKNPTGVVQSNQWSAQQIIGRADAFSAAELAMRSTRFNSQVEIRSATSQVELEAAIGNWNSFVGNLRSQLGI